jgi:tRNA (mo5U34)-methyltransferase
MRVQRRRFRAPRVDAGPAEWRPRTRPISDLISLAETPPALHIDARRGKADQYMAGLRATLETLPDGWSGGADETEDLATRVASRIWYHTIELPGGVVTPGAFDLRPIVPHYGIPESLHGKRALDIGTWDGFWAFEFERMGAEVIALDLDKLSEIQFPAAISDALDASGLDQKFGGGFALAKEALGSGVERITHNVYDIDPSNVGEFDLVHIGDVLQHLESPSRALRRVRTVTKELAIVSMTFDPRLPDEPILRFQGGWRNAVWWTASLDATGQMLVDAGFSSVVVHTAYHIRARTGGEAWEAVLHARP